MEQIILTHGVKFLPSELYKTEVNAMSLSRFTKTGDLKEIKGWARPDVYETWLAILGPGEYDKVVRAMNNRVDRMDVVRAQYVVSKGPDEWYEEYNPVYYAMNENHELSGKFIGLILWDVMLGRPENWGFHKVDKTIVTEDSLIEDIEVMEYFRIDDFPRAGRWRDASTQN